MGDNPMLNLELVKVGLEAADREAAICFLATLLERGGYVKKSFQAAVLERESTFPTGLPTGEINVAIPHADSVHVLQSAIAVGVLAEPVKFHQMGEPETSLDVDLVMVLAIQDPKAVVPFLQKACTMFQDQKLLADLKASTQSQEVVELLRIRLEN